MPVAASMHVLIVDDQMTIRSLVRSSLGQLGITNITEAADGEEAMKSLAASPVHLIISDYNMPNMDGLALLQAVRANPPTRQTAFIMLTGRAERDLVQQAVKFGVNNYLVKPFNVGVLKGKIEQVFGALT
jgi:two-component system, chemotaxis family, chemotaxis protein CheY